MTGYPTNASTTIAAPASGQGRAGVAVIRVSGPATANILKRIAGEAPPARRAALRRFVNPRDGELIDRGLALWFPGPASFTGEDMAEFHVHGGRSVVAGMMAALTDVCGCRVAQAGEFARRAFLNGKLDLAAVEGLADLIDAETEMQRRQALRQAGGALGRQIESWSQELVGVIAWAEAALDFSDEGDVPAETLGSVMPTAGRVAGEIGALLAQGRQGERLRDGFAIAIAGPPNAGKSTLLNALARRDAAIVSPIPGTTRDAIEVRMDLEGLPILLVDTAGIRDSSDPIELEGIHRARRRFEEADLVLWLTPSGESVSGASDRPAGAILIGTKSDIGKESDSAPERPKECINLSAHTGEGLDELLRLIIDRAREALGAGDGLVTRERHRQALAQAHDHLKRATSAFRFATGDELIAEDLRLALRALGAVTGKVDVEDVLGAIFAQFCIGK